MKRTSRRQIKTAGYFVGGEPPRPTRQQIKAKAKDLLQGVVPSNQSRKTTLRVLLDYTGTVDIRNRDGSIVIQRMQATSDEKHLKLTVGKFHYFEVHLEPDGLTVIYGRAVKADW